MSICMSMKIEEDTVLNQKQGIVTILNCNSDTIFTPPSLRRTLSADMSSKKWLSQNGSSNIIKKISSSQNLFGQDDDEFKETKLGDDEDDEAERERLQIWSSIQRNKMEEQHKGGSFDTWSSLMSLKTNDEISKSLPPYIHPLAKRTKSSLSRKSLEICTESLGSETGSDGLVFSYPASSESLGSETGSDEKLSSYPPSESTEDTVEQQHHTQKKQEHAVKEIIEEEVLEVERFNYGGVTIANKKSPSRSFPPPLPSLSRQDGPSLQMRPHRDNGRLVLEAVSLSSLNNFCVQRQDGRLVLTFANQDQEIAENDEVGELAEEFEGFEEEKEDEDEVDVEEYESVIGKGSIMSFEKTTIKSSVHWIGSNHKNKVNKTIGLLNRNPKWSKKFNNEVDNNKDVQVVEASQMVKSLPPRPRVARLIPSPPNAATGSFNLNSYQHYWRTTKPTSTKCGNYPLDRYQENNNTNNDNSNNDQNNKIVVTAKGETKNMNMNRVSNEKQQLLVLKGKNGDYLVHNLKNCKDSRRSFLFWEPYCIATS